MKSGRCGFSMLIFEGQNIFALPMMALVGKRYTILASLTVFLACCIWWGESTTFDQMLASRILGGLAGGLIEALSPMIVLETFPEHQLARAMVVYVGILAAGSALGPVIAGAVASQLGSWRWYARILSIGTFLLLVSCLVMLPETAHLSLNDSLDEDASPTPEKHIGPMPCGVDIMVEDNAAPQSPASLPLREIYMKRSWSAAFVGWKWKDGLIFVYQPFQLLTCPQVLVTVVVFGLTIGWIVLTSVITSNIFQAPPFLWGALEIGLLGCAPFIGLAIGLPVGGALADMMSNRAAQKKSHNPRSRLPAAIFGAILSPTGCLLIGFGLQNNLHWIVVAVGYGMLATGLTSSANVLLTYSVDCFPSRAAHVGVLVNIIKNSLAFGVSYATMDWYISMGAEAQYGIMAGLLWFSYLCVIPLWLFSNSLLKLTRGWCM